MSSASQFTILMLLALLVGVPVWRVLLDTTPQAIRDTRGAATVSFQAADSSFVLSNDCVLATWELEGISTVELNGTGVVGHDSQLSCDDQLALDVAFQDGTTERYVLSKTAVADTLPGRLSLVSVILLILLIILMALGWLIRLVPHDSMSRVYGVVNTVLPPVPKPNGTHNRNFDLFLVTLLILIGAAARTAFLSQPLKYDEAWTYMRFASQPLTYALTTYDTTNNHLFYTFLMHISVQVFGAYPWTIRLPAFFMGLLMIPMSFQVARGLFHDKTTSWLVAALVTCSAYLIEFSTNGRGYTTITVLFLGLFIIAIRLQRREQGRDYLLLAVLSALGLYTVPTMLYPLGIVWGWLLLTAYFKMRRSDSLYAILRLVASGFAALVITLVLYAPILVTETWREGETTRTLSTLGTGAFLIRLEEVANESWRLWTNDMPGWFSLMLVVGFAVTVSLSSRLKRSSFAWFWIALIWLPVITFVQQASTYPRLWLFLLPVYLMVSSAGLTYLARIVIRNDLTRRTLMASASLLIAVFLVLRVVESQSPLLNIESGQLSDSEAIVLDLRETATSGDQVICAGSCHPIRFYAKLHDFDIGYLDSSIQAGTETLYVILSTFFEDQRVIEPVISALPEEFRNLKPQHVAHYSHAEVYRFGEADDR